MCANRCKPHHSIPFPGTYRPTRPSQTWKHPRRWVTGAGSGCGPETVGPRRPTGGCDSTDSGFREPDLCCTDPPLCPSQCSRRQTNMCPGTSNTDREAQGSAHGRRLARQTALGTHKQKTLHGGVSRCVALVTRTKPSPELIFSSPARRSQSITNMRARARRAENF